MPGALDQDTVKKRLKILGFELLEPYKNSYTRLSVKCLKHGKDSLSTLRNIFSGKNLICCKKESISLHKRYSQNDVELKCKEIGFEFIDGYIGNSNDHKYKVKCLKHNEIHLVKLTSLFRNKSIKCCWREKIIRRLESGAHALRYNKELTLEYRLNYHRDHGSWDYRLWRNAVKQKYNHQCLYCLKTFSSMELHAHHVQSYSKNIDLRLDISNGATLCREHHQIFHKIYGPNSNQKQLNEFIITKGH